MLVSFIVPFYGKKDETLNMYSSLVNGFGEIIFDKEFIFIDDGSGDETINEDLLTFHPCRVIVNNSKDRKSVV